MKSAALILALTMAVLLPQTAFAQDTDDVDKARAAAFDKRMFGGPIGKKSVACFARSYDASHLAQHRKQKVSAMKLMITAEKTPGEPVNYAYKVGVQLRGKPGHFDGGSSCSHMVDDDRKKIGFSC